MRVRFSARTHVGMRREVNQDAYESRQLGRETLLVVCDGMGGHAAGEVASRLGVDAIMASFRGEDPPAESLRQAFLTANERIYAAGHGSMGTTGVAALLQRNRLHVANVGDSRAYLIREGQISQISLDHSFVSDQVAAGLMTPEQARSSNIRNIITRALGHSAEVEVDLFNVDLLAGDTVLLSSDGMHGVVADNEIAEVAGMLPPDEAAQRLVDLSNERGGPDNITVVIAQIDELDAPGADADTPAAQDDTPTLPAGMPAAHAAALTATAPAPPVERPLSRLGLALASLTLLILVGFGSFLFVTTGRSQTTDTAATAPAAVASATSTPPRPTLTPAPSQVTPTP